MTAEGTACNGAGEAPRAEFAAEKVAAAPPLGKAPAEREGEDVGGPFVIVNGDSDGLSDRGSDLGKAPDEDSPSEEDNAPGSNAAPDAPAGGDHGAPAAEAAGASGAAPGVSSADGHDRAAEETEGAADEGKGEPGADFVPAEVVLQETVGGEQGGADVVVASGSDRAITGADSDAPAVDVEVSGKEGTEEESAATDVTESVQEAASEEQEVADAAAESCGHDDALTNTESGSAAIESVHGDGSKEQSAAIEVEPVEEGTGGPDSLVATERFCADTKADSFEAAAEPESPDDASKSEQKAAEVVSADSCIVASESESHGDELKGQENDQQGEGAPMAEAETAGRNCVSSVDEPIKQEVVADGHNYAEVSADASGEREAAIEKVECEATCGILQTEEKMDCMAGVASNEEVKPPIEEIINEVVPGSGELKEVTEHTSQDIVQGDAETDPSLESSQEDNVQVDETTSESNVKAENVLEVNTAAPLPSQQNCDSAVETVENEQSEAPNVGQPNEIENDVAESEAKKEVETELVHDIPLQAAAASAASTFNKEPQPTDLVDNGSFKHSSPLVTELESCDHSHTEERRSREASDTTVDQLISGASLEHGTTVADEAELISETGDASQEKPSDSAIDQGEPATLNVDELVVDDAQSSSATGYESARFNKVEDISKKDESSDIAGDSKSHEDQSEICNASTTCDVAEDISSENLNGSTKSSDVVETKCLEEHKVDDKHAHDEEAKVVEDSIELHGDLDKNNIGDAQVVRQQKVYIIKVPRFAGEDLWAKIQDAHAHLDKLTQERDAINIQKQNQKVVCDQYRENLEAARREEREARAAHGDKKNDLNNVRSVIGKLHQANSIEDIDEMIATKEKIMLHETISLKEEKLLIKEINDLKAQRKQLCSSMGSKAEISEAFDQKDHIHERHKTLKKDSDVLFTNLKSLEENTKKILKSFEDERIAFRKLNEEYRVANERRQKAYSDWSNLKAEPFKKNRYFFQYKDDRRIAGDYISSGDMHGLQLYCNNQIERVMEIWNNDEDFRKQYIEANKVSTLRRLGTHDGRRLGPDEEPPVIPSRRPINPSSSLTVSSPDVPIVTTPVAAPVLATPVSVPVNEESFPVLPSPQISRSAKSKACGTPVQHEKIAVAVSERDVKQMEKEKARRMEEELELARKAEELARREERLREERAAAEKERLRLEQKAKAKEAEERKRRKAEKAQGRAEFKARKEAEEKEKKKAKKDKKKGPADSSANGDSNATAMATADTDSNASDNPREVDMPQPTAPKRISRPAAAIKQLNRVQPMPAPLRNRGKRKMRQYILVAVAMLSVLALFVAGNYIPRLKSLHF